MQDSTSTIGGGGYAGPITLDGGGSTLSNTISLAGDVDTSGTLTLEDTSGISQAVGSLVTAGTLVATSSGDIQLAESGNQISDLGAISAAGSIDVSSGTLLTVTSTVSSSGSQLITLTGQGIVQDSTSTIGGGGDTGPITLDGGGSSISLAGDVDTSGTLTLQDTSGISQAVGSLVTAGTLVATSSGDISLAESGNLISSLGTSRRPARSTSAAARC